jgi:hypothetical protein
MAEFITAAMGLKLPVQRGWVIGSIHDQVTAAARHHSFYGSPLSESL